MASRILILSDPFSSPSFTPRLRCLCDSLVEHEYEVDVYTEEDGRKTGGANMFEHNYAIHEFPLYHGSIDWVIKSAWSLLTDWRNRHFSREVRKAIKEKEYDLVFCTTFSTFPLRAARDVAREKHLPLYVDIRDLDEQVPNAQYQHHRQWWARPWRNWYRAVNIRRRNKILREAECITTISPWHVEFIQRLINKTDNVHLIYNGFDQRQFYFEPVKTERFIISYIGRIYEFQNLELIEQAIKEMGNTDIYLNLHTPNNNPIPIEEVANEIRCSSVMLVLTNPEAKGMMTTKFYEALGCEKPVLCIPSDKGYLAQAISKTHAGAAASDIEEIKAFIAEKYEEWKANGYTHQAVQNKELFTRQNQARQFEDLFNHSTLL